MIIAGIGVIGMIARHVIAMATAMTARVIVLIGDRRRSIASHAIARHLCIVAGMRMCAGAIIATALTALMTIRSSPITGHDASAIHPISETKKPRLIRGFFLHSSCFGNQVTKAPIEAATSPMATAIITP